MKLPYIHISNNMQVKINGCICIIELWMKGGEKSFEIRIIDTTNQTKGFKLKDSYSLEELQDRVRDGRIEKM